MVCLDASFGFGWVIVRLTDDFYNIYFVEEMRHTKVGSNLTRLFRVHDCAYERQSIITRPESGRGKRSERDYTNPIRAEKSYFMEI